MLLEQRCVNQHYKSQFDKFFISVGLRSDVVSEVKQGCVCQVWNNCKWTIDQVSDMTKMSRHSLIWEKSLKFVRARICDYKKRTVYCCDEESPPTISELKTLRETSNVKSRKTSDLRFGKPYNI